MTARTQPTSDSTNDPRQDGRRRLQPATLIHEISQARIEKELRKRQAMVDGWEATWQYMREELTKTGRRIALMTLLFLAGSAAWAVLKSFAGG